MNQNCNDFDLKVAYLFLEPHPTKKPTFGKIDKVENYDPAFWESKMGVTDEIDY